MKNNKTLVILAAGMGSRYGGMKQIQPLGPSKEAILDYAIYDAISVGFNKLVFVIRKEIGNSISNVFYKKWENYIDIQTAYQSVHSYCPPTIASERSKPWGTAHALLCAREKTTTPFAIINADDFYGKDAFLKATGFLDRRCSASNYGLVTYSLEHTLSNYGTVNRGICKIEETKVQYVQEVLGIKKKEQHICYTDTKNTMIMLDANTPVSMNYLCFSPSIFDYAYNEFEGFLRKKDALKKEFFIPLLLNNLLHSTPPPITIESLATSSKWFGITYPEDNTIVTTKLKEMHNAGTYPTPVWNMKSYASKPLY